MVFRQEFLLHRLSGVFVAEGQFVKSRRDLAEISV